MRMATLRTALAGRTSEVLLHETENRASPTALFLWMLSYNKSFHFCAKDFSAVKGQPSMERLSLGRRTHKRSQALPNSANSLESFELAFSTSANSLESFL